MVQKTEKQRVYFWAAKAFTSYPTEVKHLLKYGTPSNHLISVAEGTNFIFSLNTRAGQEALYKACIHIDSYLKTIPIQAYNTLQDVKLNVTHRRKDTQSNIHMVAEAIFHRAASEFKHEILFAFDSINVWIKAAYGKELGYLTIRRCLELLAEAKIIKVNEWGKRGNRSKCTKIEFIPQEPSKGQILTYTSKVDSWLDSQAHAMTAVYRRESTTRQDVLEQRIHHFADQVAQDESRYAQGHRLFPVSDDKLSVQTLEIVNIEEEVLWDDAYIDRLLGSLVPSVHKDVTYSGEISSSIRGPD